MSLSERGFFLFWLIYSSDISLDDAVSHVYRLETNYSIKDMALSLRDVILKAFTEFPDLPWPPTADELDQRAHEELPEKLQRFLIILIAWCDLQPSCEKTNRLVYSIG